jgi:hypothetical protein
MNNSTAHELPDDVVLSVRHVSKKFCRNLRRSMWYGMQDLGRNLLGIRPKTGEEGVLNVKRETLGVNRPRQDSNLLATVHDSRLSNNSSVGSNDSQFTNNVPTSAPSPSSLSSSSDSGLKFHPSSLILPPALCAGMSSGHYRTLTLTRSAAKHLDLSAQMGAGKQHS